MDIAEALDAGLAKDVITYIKGTVYRAKTLERVYDYVELPGENKVNGDKKAYAAAFSTEMHDREHVLVQEHKDSYVVQNPPADPLTTDELDLLYSLPFNKKAHPSYNQSIPALDEVKYSITATRGCIGSCAFCALYYHQGKDVVSRSKQSILDEAASFVGDKEFKGYVHDVGGPTANLYGLKCTNPKGGCNKRRCMIPKPCKYLKENHAGYISVLKSIRNMPGIKKVFVRSGIRHDYALLDKSGTFINEMAKHHVSGQLRLAPEHVSDGVLDTMGKPHIDKYEQDRKSVV